MPGAAILMEAVDPIRLVDDADLPLPLPVIDGPSEALGVLARSSDQVYVAHQPPMDARDLGLGDKPRWLVGVMPFGGARARA